MTDLFIGLMSGTSIDGIDAALLGVDKQRFQLIDHLEFPIPALLREQLLALCLPGDNEIDRMGAADRQMGELFAEASLALLAQSNTNPAAVRAIGSHGQTIRHRPGQRHAFTLQIGDANIIAHRTGITTVADFRRKDMAAGGQGAPLAPAFHRAVFGQKGTNRAIINIGGMANISPLVDGNLIAGFDTGPGNVLMDAWIEKHLNKSFDHNGEWAASGQINRALLTRLLSHPYFSLAAPKSTGREDFNLPWLEEILASFPQLPAANVQASLLELTAQSIAQALQGLSATTQEIAICGGGACNQQLLNRLQALQPSCRVTTTAELGIAPEWVEAAAFAWLAKQTLEGLTGSAPQVTGADKACVLGAIYSGS